MRLKRSIIPGRITLKSRDIYNMSIVNEVSSLIARELKNNSSTHITVHMGGNGDTTRNRLLTAIALKQSFENASGTKSHDKVKVSFKKHKSIEAFYDNMITSDSISSDDIKRGMNIGLTNKATQENIQKSETQL